MANFYGNDIQKVKNVTVGPNLPYTKFLTVFDMWMYQEFLKKDFLLAKSRVYYMYNNIF